MPLDHISAVAFLGLIAGALGGIAGVGGSVIILPGLHLLFSDLVFGEPANPESHHLYMAAAMCVNVCVAIPAAIRHHREGAVRTALLPVLIPCTVAAVVCGVLASNTFTGGTLTLILAVFLIAVCSWNLRFIARPRRRKFGGQGRVEHTTTPRLVACSAATGIVGGLLGLGGGFLLVPLLQILCNLRLKNAIATSSAVLSVTACVSATLKVSTLSSHHVQWTDALTFAACMAPTAVVGSLLGAKWLHVLPVTGVRLVITILILAVATRLL